LGSAADDIEQAFASGEFPEIVIENGFAMVRARQPLTLMEGGGSIIILDTSGTYQSIDTSRTALNLWRSFASIFSVAAFIGIGIWNLAIRFMWLTLLAVLIWGLLSAFNMRAEYGPVLTAGIYALVPAVYISFLLGLIGISFCGFQTGLLLVIWVVVARPALKARDASEAPPQPQGT
jgi:hypothetical protein